MAGLAVLTVLYLVMILADFIAPYNFTATHRNFIYAPPTKIRFFDEDGRWRGPFVYPLTRSRDPVTFQLVFTEDRSRIVPVKLCRARNTSSWAYSRPTSTCSGWRSLLTPPWFSALRGRQVWPVRFLSRAGGSQVSLTVGLLGTFLSVFIGAIVGALSAYYGGWVVIGIQRFTELLRSFPRIPLWLALAVIVPPSWPSTWVYFGIVTVLSLIGWMGVARVVRGMVLSLREKEFVLAAQVMGVPSMKIITKHLIPNTLSYLIVVSTLSIPGMILGESTISFLGLGIKEPMTSWGLLLKQAQSLSELQSHPWLMVPGLFIIVAVLSFNFVGDALRDAVDPYRTVEKV